MAIYWHLAGGLGGKDGATLQFVSSKSLTKKAYMSASCIMVW